MMKNIINDSQINGNPSDCPLIRGIGIKDCCINIHMKDYSIVEIVIGNDYTFEINLKPSTENKRDLSEI
jgi:hypothetical protein